MSDYSTHDDGLGGKALVVAAVLIGIFILGVAFLGAGDPPNLPAGLAEQPALEGAAPAADAGAAAVPATE